MIGFRIDANEYVATGHMMRCMAIALACMKAGACCIFYLAENKYTDRLDEAGINYKIIDSKWNDLEYETEKLCKLVKEDNIEWLVVDSYYVTNRYLSKVNEVCNVMYVDDLSEEIYNVSAMLHYYPWNCEQYKKKYESIGVETLVGCRYVPLRDEFINLSETDKRDRSILFTSGGTDPYNVTMSFLNYIEQSRDISKFDIYIIVGNMNIYEKEIRDFAKDKRNIHILKNINNMSYYMKKCSYAVSAGGTTLFELCACKIPTVCFSFADNQLELTKNMHEDNIMLYAGDVRNISDIGHAIMQKLILYLEDKTLKEKSVQNMEALVDGKGADRIAKFLLQ